MRIGLLEDDMAQSELMSAWVKGAGHDCYCYQTGRDFKNAIKKETYDLLLIDWNLPDTTGPDVLDWVRTNIDWHIPILFITSRDSEEDIVHALEHGADDYMIKPVKQQETLARLKALGRRAQPGKESSFSLDAPPYHFNISERSATIDGEPVDLRAKELNLAILLFQNVGRLLSRSYLLENIWGTSGDLNTRTVDTHVSRLRTKLGIKPDRGWRLNAVYQHGYRLEQVSSK